MLAHIKTPLFLAVSALLLSACSTLIQEPGTNAPLPKITGGILSINQCTALQGQAIAADAIGVNSDLLTGSALIESATWMAATPLTIAPGGPTPAARITPATQDYCKVLGHIKPVTAAAPNINFQVNLPKEWNGRSVQFGGGGFNGVLITGLTLVPASPFGSESPLKQGFVTVGTDSGHQNKTGEPPQTFALNNEALVNFFHASYKKVRDVSVAITQQAYGKSADKLYFVGSSEGGREGLMMAQRYPKDFNGIFSRVPVIHWTGLQHKGLEDGKALMNGGWMNDAQVKLVHDRVLAACDEMDGTKDGIVSDPVGCKAKFDTKSLLCAKQGDSNCLSATQVNAINVSLSPLKFSFPLANGVSSYPARGPSAEGVPANGPTGGWGAWWTGKAAPVIPPVQANGIAWYYGAGAIQYFYMQDPKGDLMSYTPEKYRQRVEYVSSLMDATNPDLSAFHAAGGKLIMLENLGDYAQSPYAGIQYFEAVQEKMGAGKVASFAKLYTAPNVDHVGAGAPGNVDMLTALTAWVEGGQAPRGLTLAEQPVALPFTPSRTRPLCEWPALPRYKGGDVNLAASFSCEK